MPFVIQRKADGGYRRAIRQWVFTKDLNQAKIHGRRVDAINSLQLVHGRPRNPDPSNINVIIPADDPWISPASVPQWRDPMQDYDIIEVKQTIELA